MKTRFLAILLLLSSLLTSVAHAQEPSAETLLQRLNQASQTLNYELSYILIRKNSIEPILYRQASDIEGDRFAQLIYLSGPVREVILRGGEVSYIEPGIEPFSVKSTNMVAPLMPMLNVDIDSLASAYDFVAMGRAREAGVSAQVVRIVPKDGKRYSYVVWIDENSYLPIRGDLVDRTGEVLEQYRTVAFTVDDKLAELMVGLKDVELPPVFKLPNNRVSDSNWIVNNVPVGFEAKPHTRYRMPLTNKVVESQIFSDGLFQFSVYITEQDNLTLRNQLVRQGRRTFQSQQLGDKEVIVVGDIPPETANEIARSVSFAAVAQP
ncbi:sigma-E factor regulatory protein RseB [Vibrio ulleungensis]|uniref:Sigma-E factor regulatory protein RseB n=1 Tax=Vibrio ulleungensis TaxID=2807619 RepID=A0ABS2HK87_9VIBR|nr:sigma-E factor regulatory protein RseB [Vibrio ulleungensis]MBM7037905.1 sigma-E factor regulatory protein RseB [Vibrio ulleungensis]